METRGAQGKTDTEIQDYYNAKKPEIEVRTGVLLGTSSCCCQLHLQALEDEIEGARGAARTLKSRHSLSDCAKQTPNETLNRLSVQTNDQHVTFSIQARKIGQSRISWSFVTCYGWCGWRNASAISQRLGLSRFILFCLNAENFVAKYHSIPKKRKFQLMHELTWSTKISSSCVCGASEVTNFDDAIFIMVILAFCWAWVWINCYCVSPWCLKSALWFVVSDLWGAASLLQYEEDDAKHSAAPHVLLTLT